MDESLYIVCPQCNAVNRAPDTRLEAGPKCGQCHQPLFTGQPVELNGTGFDAHTRRNSIPVVVDFWAEWCGPCKMMAPQFVKAAGELEPQVRFAKVDTEAEPSLGTRFGIRSIPTLILFKDGKEVARQPGAMRSADIVRWVKGRI